MLIFRIVARDPTGGEIYKLLASCDESSQLRAVGRVFRRPRMCLHWRGYVDLEKRLRLPQPEVLQRCLELVSRRSDAQVRRWWHNTGHARQVWCDRRAVTTAGGVAVSAARKWRNRPQLGHFVGALLHMKLLSHTATTACDEVHLQRLRQCFQLRRRGHGRRECVLGQVMPLARRRIGV